MRRSVVLALALAGCAYDWDVGPLPSDGAFDSLVADTAVVDGNKPDTTDCAALLAEVVRLREVAKRCTPTAMVCEQVVVDECGCESVTAVAGADTNLYANAAKAFRDAGCTSAACGSCQAIKKDFCLVADGGGTSCAGP